jgi:hypothetical protein
MAHCAEQRGHAYTGRPAAEVDGNPHPATPIEERDTRNLRKIRGESFALQGGDEADQQYSTAVDGSPEFRSELGDPEANGEAWERVSPRHRLESLPDFDLTLVDIENEFVPGSESLIAVFEELGDTVGRDVQWTVIPGQEHNARSHAEELDRYGVVGSLLLQTVDA